MSNTGTYATNEWGDEGNASLSAGNSLGESEEEGKVAVDAVLLLELTGSLDTFPCRGDLDEDAVLVDTNRLVESDELLGLGLGGLLVEREARVNFGGDVTRDDLQDLGAKLDELRQRTSISEKLRYAHSRDDP